MYTQYNIIVICYFLKMNGDFARIAKYNEIKYKLKGKIVMTVYCA